MHIILQLALVFFLIYSTSPCLGWLSCSGAALEPSWSWALASLTLTHLQPLPWAPVMVQLGDCKAIWTTTRVTATTAGLPTTAVSNHSWSGNGEQWGWWEGHDNPIHEDQSEDNDQCQQRHPTATISLCSWGDYSKGNNIGNQAGRLILWSHNFS